MQFVHGFEGSPQGAKARLFAEHFTALTPAMGTSDFENCVAVHADHLASFGPDVLVGSSFGGAVALELLHRGVWRGPTLLLAPAVARRGPAAHLPDGVRVWIVHGLRDALVPIDGSRALARTGSPELVRLIEVDDDHALHGLVQSGELVTVVRDLIEAASAA